MERSLTALTLAVIAAACSAGSGPPPRSTPTPVKPAVDPALLARIDRHVTTGIAEGSVAGVSIAVVNHGEVTVAKGYGLADVAGKVAVGPDTIFRIASITKQFTAVAILKLAAAGKLALDDEIARFLPDYPTHGKTITIRHLLTHTSGIKNYTEIEAVKRKNRALPREQLVAMFATLPLDFEPGAKWSYSNSGYYLLGLVIEKASGRSYADYVHDQIILPTGLADTGYCDDQPGPRRARGYTPQGSSLALADPLDDMEDVYADGGLCSTALDLVKWGQALANHVIVSEAQWNQMITPVTLGDGSTFEYGFGLAMGEKSGHKAISHGGSINGFMGQLAAYPDDHLFVAVLVNTTGSPLADVLIDQIARAALGIPEPEQQDLPLSAEQGTVYAGVYEFAAVGITLEFFYEGYHLKVKDTRGGPTFAARHEGDHVFAVDHFGARARFKVVDGKATELSVEQGGFTLVGPRKP